MRHNARARPRTLPSNPISNAFEQEFPRRCDSGWLQAQREWRAPVDALRSNEQQICTLAQCNQGATMPIFHENHKACSYLQLILLKGPHVRS